MEKDSLNTVEKKDYHEDNLFYRPYAKIVADAAGDPSLSPMTIGIFGTWGTGKSTLMEMAKYLLEHPADGEGSKIVCITLNAWSFEGYDDAKTAMMEGVLDGLQQSSLFAGMQSKFKSLLEHVDYLKTGAKFLASSASLALNLLLGLRTRNIINIGNSVPETTSKVVGNLASGLSFEENGNGHTTVKSVRKFRTEFAELLEAASVDNVVVFVDDLDRCMPDAIIEMLEAIRLFLTVPKLNFVIAADDAVIRYAVNRRYSDAEGQKLDLAGEYVEKMFQMPVYIPGLSNKDIENHLLLLTARKHLSQEHYAAVLRDLHERRRILQADRIETEEIRKIIRRCNLLCTPSEQEFLEDMQVMDQVRGLIAPVLHGNPRKAGRFVWTLESKLELGELYFSDPARAQYPGDPVHPGRSRIPVRRDILAKLLALREISSDLFLLLYQWNQHFDGENSEYREMLQALLADPGAEGDPESYPEWRIPLVRKWVLSEPVDLHKYRLDRYFYLFRESLPVPGSPMVIGVSGNRELTEASSSFAEQAVPDHRDIAAQVPVETDGQTGAAVMDTETDTAPGTLPENYSAVALEDWQGLDEPRAARTPRRSQALQNAYDDMQTEQRMGPIPDELEDLLYYPI